MTVQSQPWSRDALVPPESTAEKGFRLIPLLGKEGAKGWSKVPLYEPPKVPINQEGHSCERASPTFQWSRSAPVSLH
jgi:hypothetical protein